MDKLVLVVHLLTALAIVGVILLQRGKGAEAGASFGGGASQTLFGSAGSWNFFSKFTAVLATLFFATSLTLAVMARNDAGVGGVELPALEIINEQQSTSDEHEIPVIDIEPEAEEIDSLLAIPELDESGTATQ